MPSPQNLQSQLPLQSSPVPSPLQRQPTPTCVPEDTHLNALIFICDVEQTASSSFGRIGWCTSSSQGLQLNINSQSSFCKKWFYLKPPISQQKRYLEMRKNGRMEKACKSIPEVSLEVDRVAIRLNKVTI
ncbi:unnamed protein product [Linum tenue]|uniref:Uncharacterized protein n=1 Tax=Linum tenue TaxID=586396 RepID=A0AAV0KQF5_9ROSI|nr:unnamed protein product [Linum tenue]